MLHLLKTLKHLIHCVFSCHINNPLTMENPPRVKFTPNFFIIISLSLGLFSFIFCVEAEIKRNKVQMLTTIFTASICSPEIKTFEKGTLFCRRMISGGLGSYVLCHQARPLDWELQLWVSFGFAAILLMVATSMNRRQAYRVGWLNGECYVVKGGTYAGSAMLVLFTVCSVNGSVFCTLKSSQPNQPTKVHKPMG
ncbi:protein MODIFYING WALL LIGNIN-1 isoform X2 [Vigna angularis]|uniref:protein MODIFYING WALL LIGNIN-1 isoform X2 n=1 Tax=Phaseolus angularis TaxID=3914 RepID=UPI0022B37D67|nr:protein MODIFYING WALL LIGNIN-1 isoform X2 [Vigna angularis]